MFERKFSLWTLRWYIDKVGRYSVSNTMILSDIFIRKVRTKSGWRTFGISATWRSCLDVSIGVFPADRVRVTYCTAPMELMNRPWACICYSFTLDYLCLSSSCMDTLLVVRFSLLFSYPDDFQVWFLRVSNKMYLR